MLTDLKCRSAKPRDKAYKIADERGLYLFVLPSGSRSWRLKYRFADKEKRLTFGLYPEVSLSEARERRDEARRMIRDGVDPQVHKKQRRAETHTRERNTFEQAARRWHDGQKPHWAPRYGQQLLDRFENDMFPTLGALPVTAITVPLLLGALRAIEERGATETAHRIRQHVSDIFETAIAAGIVTSNPAAGIRKALGKVRHGHRPAVLDVTAARAVIRHVESAPAYAITRLASRLLALTAVRPSMIRLAVPEEFEDLDGDAPLWRIPADKMKLTAAQKRDVRHEFLVPLSRQAVDVVKTALESAGGGPLLFPSVRNPRSPISDATLSSLYRSAGFTGVHVPHGWRSSFSTVMNALAAMENRVGDREVIDLMLAHMAAGVEPIYNRYAYMPRRRAVAQEWADLLFPGEAPAAALFDGERGSSPRARRRLRA